MPREAVLSSLQKWQCNFFASPLERQMEQSRHMSGAGDAVAASPSPIAPRSWETGMRERRGGGIQWAGGLWFVLLLAGVE